jgi:hypothetical protein
MIKKLSEHETLSLIIRSYKNDPGAYTDEEIASIATAAAAAGIQFQPEFSTTRAAKVFFSNLADTMTFGLFPDSMMTQPLTEFEKYIGWGGSLAGLMTGPFAVGKKLATSGMKGLSSLAAGKSLLKAEGTLAKTISKMAKKGADTTTGSVAKALNDAATHENAQKAAKWLLERGDRTRRAMVSAGMFGSQQALEQIGEGDIFAPIGSGIQGAIGGFMMPVRRPGVTLGQGPVTSTIPYSGWQLSGLAAVPSIMGGTPEEKAGLGLLGLLPMIP